MGMFTYTVTTIVEINIMNEPPNSKYYSFLKVHLHISYSSDVKLELQVYVTGLPTNTMKSIECIIYLYPTLTSPIRTRRDKQLDPVGTFSFFSYHGLTIAFMVLC